ncbi:hypothetical protein SLS55_007951 [Diplodia seriata]
MSSAANKTKKPASPTRGGGGWSNCLFTFVADAAGKAWEYARSTGIIGFYAGGGKGYTLQTPTDNYGTTPTFSRHVRTSSSFDISRTPVPGQYPPDEEEYAVRAPKRQHEDSGPDSWIMVPRMDEELRAATPGLSKRRPPKVNISRPTGPRRPLIPVARRTSSISSLNSPGLRPESAASIRRPDSAASVRRPDSAASIRRSDSAASFRRPDSAASNRTRPHSMGSAFTLPSPNTPHSPMTPEIQMLAAQRRREERQRNTSMRKINDRLKDMIREGREALGTRVEIEDAMDEDMEDEGFAEGCFDGREKW